MDWVKANKKAVGFILVGAAMIAGAAFGLPEETQQQIIQVITSIVDGL